MAGKSAIPPKFHHYSRWDVISAFHKELRRGDYENASYWLQVMISGGAPTGYLVTYLWQIASEELAPSEMDVVNYLAHLRANISNLFPYHLYYAVLKFCRAKKWWEDADGKLAREMWAKHALNIEAGKFRDIPHYAHDKHTARGRALLARGEADRRWEGTWTGMVFRSEAHDLLEQERQEAEARGEQPNRTRIDEVTWNEVWGRPEAKGQLEFWDQNGDKVCA